MPNKLNEFKPKSNKNTTKSGLRTKMINIDSKKRIIPKIIQNYFIINKEIL